MPRPSSYTSLAARFAAGHGSPTQELQARLSRLDAIDPEIGAFVQVAREAALAAAAEADRRWRNGAPLSAIDGMAIGIKDIFETEDMPTGQGSPVWEGFETRRDAAAVQALRAAGAIILGKTTTTEFAATEPLMPVRNPHDRSRTAGGSSSGSAAAVGAGILPAALGTQVVGSTLRPASYCGCVGYKPTFGALNRSGSFDHLSQSCLGILATTPEDAWLVASAIVTRVGGDPGHEGLTGPTAAPAPVRPSSLAVLETAGWAKATSGARAAFAGACQLLTKLGIGLADRHSDPAVEAFEATISEANAVTFRIFDWEFRWPLTGYAARNGLSEGMRRRVESAQQLTLDDYREALRRRREIRAEYAKLGLRYDGIVTLAATGAAPIGLSWTGDPTINIPASLLGVPAISLPFLSDENMPLGLQLIGRAQEDAHLLAVAQWLWHNYPTSE